MRDPTEWVARLQAGDEEAWKEFIRVFSRFVPIVAAPLGLSDVEREEAVQEMTITAYRSIGNLRDPSRLASWVYTIARRSALSLRRRRRRQPLLGADGLELDRFPSPQVPVDEILAGWDEGKRLRRAVEALPENCRNLVTALFLEDPRPSYKEISGRYGTPLGSIGPTLARCLTRLHVLWKGVSREI